MKTHENADPDNPYAQVDFCWDINIYNKIVAIQMYIITPTSTGMASRIPEGVKMALIEE